MERKCSGHAFRPGATQGEGARTRSTLCLEGEGILTIRDVSRLMKVCRSHLYRWIHSYGFPGRQVAKGGKFFFFPWEVAKWIERNTLPESERRLLNNPGGGSRGARNA